jgi:hypothetical protein
MTEKESVPFAPNLVESMRSLGYSFKTAIADLIDNSVGALAKNIDIIMIPNDDPYLIILDDGFGMTNLELELAMKFGSKNPLEQRNDDDLGRYGLGMKSASLSQCRKLTVASKKNGYISCYSWDIDYINEKKNWVLIEYDEFEINKLPNIERFKKLEHGTYLLLQNFDRVSASTQNLSNTLNSNLSETYDHLALIFHRFIDDGLKIYINNNLIEGRDPFLRSNHSTQILKEIEVKADDYPIKIRPFILPHINKLSNDDIKKVGGIDDLKNYQGFYIYRNNRLIIYGTWFKLYKKDELSKLARIMVDIPKELDYMWSIDIKKSSASLPDTIKNKLYSCIDLSVLGSKKVYEYRGRKTTTEDIIYIWDRFENRNHKFEYRINRDLPQLSILESQLDSKQITILNNFLNLVEESIPYNQIYLDIANNVYNQVDDQQIDDMVYQINEMMNIADQNGLNRNDFLDIILKTEPYVNCKELQERFRGVDE